MRLDSRGRPGVSSIVGSIFFVLIMIVAIASLVTIFNSFTAYNKQVSKAGSSNVQAQDTSLSVTGSQFGAYPQSSPSNFNVATTGCTTTSTLPTNQQELFYAAGMWWDFFTCNSSFLYSTSFDGATWDAATAIPNVVPGYTVGPYFDIQVVGSTIYLVISSHTTLRFQLGIGTLASGGTGSAPSGTITWTSPPAEVTTGAQPTGPIQIEVDGAGNQWIAVTEGTCNTASNCQIQIYERQGSCASGTLANYGWEPNACTSPTAPTNYAPTTPNLGALAQNANAILLPPPSTLASTGAVLVYETSSTSVSAGTTGTIAVITQSSLAQGGATWNAMTLTGITDYSLTSSSALFIGNTMYFAGLQNAATGQTTGALKFWTLPFTSMTAATATSEQTIESGTAQAWMAALEVSGTTLALFDAYPVAGTVQYYTSSTLGSSGLWSSAITLESAETQVNELSPAAGGFAVTWANSVPNVRFAALSTITVSNGSPFSVHLVDLYVQDTAANLLRAHYYFNSTEDFDYWVGQGSTAVLPVRFTWAASTSYLVTVGTDAGVTAQLTATSPPVAAVACPSGSFFSQISPTTACATTLSTESYLISGAGANTCTDTTSGTALMMGLGMSYTTSAISSGNLYISFAFQVTSPATSAITSTWRLYYGTGTVPGCDGAATGTAIGQAYTVKSQAAVVRGLSQSVGATLTGLSPGTTYWFDVQATDSSTAAWIYSNPDMGLIDVQTTDSPNLTTSTNTNTCTATAGAVKMAGFGTTFTTGGAGFTGDVFGKLSFNVGIPATNGVNSKYTISYGTGTAPACNAAAAGTATGNQYTVASQNNVAGGSGQKAGFVLTGLAASTTYWVDVQVVDSSGVSWVYSNPTLAVMEMPASTNPLPAVATASNTNTCTVATASAYMMAGFGVKYNVPSSAVGDLYITLTFQVTTAPNSNVNSQWQVAYETGAAPACDTPAAGTTVGNTYTVTSQSATAGGTSQSETFVLHNVEHVAGTAIWVDLEVFDSTNNNWIFSNPEISVAEFPG